MDQEWAEIYFKELQTYKGMYEEKRKENERLKGVIEWEKSYEKRCLVLEKQIEKIEDQLNRIKVLVIECDADNRAPQPYEILDIINE